MAPLPPKWIVFSIALWILSSLVFAIAEGAWLGSDQTSVIQQLTDSRLFTAEDITGKIAGAFSGTLWAGLFRVATFDYGILNSGPWEIFRWIVFFPITMVLIYSVVLQTARLVRGGG